MDNNPEEKDPPELIYASSHLGEYPVTWEEKDQMGKPTLEPEIVESETLGVPEQ